MDELLKIDTLHFAAPGLSAPSIRDPMKIRVLPDFPRRLWRSGYQGSGDRGQGTRVRKIRIPSSVTCLLSSVFTNHQLLITNHRFFVLGPHSFAFSSHILRLTSHISHLTSYVSRLTSHILLLTFCCSALSTPSAVLCFHHSQAANHRTLPSGCSVHEKYRAGCQWRYP